ncbi:MAG: hypothetical protein EA428_01945 [Spirochaetaceae bacterium]|nr:MAG: hypothetical protein EA428_01945 [Spirochaetaceae bacterium]
MRARPRTHVTLIPKAIPMLVLLLVLGLVMSMRPPVIAADTLNERLLNELREAGPEGASRVLQRETDERAFVHGVAFVQELLQAQDGPRAVPLLEYLGVRADAAAPHADGAALIELLALARYQQGRAREAIRLLGNAGENYRTLGLPVEELNSRRLLASVQHGYGMLEAGQRSIDRALELEDYFDDELHLASALAEAAMINYKLGQLDPVPGLLDRARGIYEAQGHDNGMGTVLRTYGNYYIGLGELDRALEKYEAASEYYERTNNLHDYANTSFNIGLTYMNLGRPMAAVSYLENAITNFLSAGSRSGAGMAGTELARVFLLLGRVGEATRIIEVSINNLRDSQSNRRLAGAYSVQGGILGSQGRREEALDAYRNALRLYRDLGLQREQAQLEQVIQQVESELADELSL